MIYIEYEAYKNRYYESQKKYHDILNEKEMLFAMTQPKTVKFDSEPVKGGVHNNIFDEYLILKEKKNIQRAEVMSARIRTRQRTSPLVLSPLTPSTLLLSVLTLRLRTHVSAR